MVFQCVFTSFKDYLSNMNYNLDLFLYKMCFLIYFFNHSGMDLALSKGPEHPNI